MGTALDEAYIVDRSGRVQTWEPTRFSRELLCETELDPLYTGAVVRIREIIDPEFRQRIVEALADRRGCSPAAIPEWFELDDADFVDLLNDMKEQDDAGDYLHDPRM